MQEQDGNKRKEVGDGQSAMLAIRLQVSTLS